MWVDVVELRKDGKKRPREEVLAAKPVRGFLQMTAGRPGYYAGQRNPPLLATLNGAGERMPEMLSPLDQARVVKISRGALLIAGVQEVVRPIRRFERFPQAWWCIPVQPA
jgi:hypothetical protein